MSSSRSDIVTHSVCPSIRLTIFYSHKKIQRIIGINREVKLAQNEVMLASKVQGCVRVIYSCLRVF